MVVFFENSDENVFYTSSLKSSFFESVSSESEIDKKIIVFNEFVVNGVDFYEFSRESFENFCWKFLVVNWFVEPSDGIEHLEFYGLWIDVIEIRKSDFSV